jgi:hypothetical protein
VSSLVEPLRVGILIDRLDQPAWVRRVLEDVRSTSGVELALVIQNAAYRPTTLLQDLRAYRDKLLPLAYDRLDAALVRHRRQPDAFRRVSIRDLVEGCPSLQVEPLQKRFSDYFSDQDVETILAYSLDVALRFGFRILRGRALQIARYGVWSHHHADNRVLRGGPNSFWEVMEARPVTGAVLQVLTERLDDGKVIARTWSATDPSSLSLSRNRLYWKTAALVGRALRDLQQDGSAGLEQEADQHYAPYSERLHTRPSNLQAVPILARFAVRNLRRLAGDLVGERPWSLAYSLGQPGDEMPTAFHNFKVVQAPTGCSWSEPFPFCADGKRVVFFKEQATEGDWSRVAVLALDEQGRPGPPTIALATGDRLGYPFVFEWRGERWLLPDTGGSELTLYRCRSFPGDWQAEQRVLPIRAGANPTLFEQDGRWWLFVNLAEPGAALEDELHLFWADSPLGPWQPYRRNPIRSDARAALPAGGLFNWRGQLYRPARDCSAGPGSAIAIQLVERLGPHDYSEREVARILPRWRPGLLANGTLNHYGGLTCIDFQTRRARRPVNRRKVNE